MSIHPEHPGPPHPKITLLSLHTMHEVDINDALERRANGASWAELARMYQLPGWYMPDAGDEAARAIWTVAGEPGAPRWEDQPICACGAWAPGDAAQNYFRGCDAAFERWVAEHGGVS